VTVFSNFSVTFSLIFLGFFGLDLKAVALSKCEKFSDLFVFRDGAGGLAAFTFQLPGGGSAIGWRWDFSGGPSTSPN